MNHEHDLLEPLPPDIVEILNDERTAHGPSADIKDRVYKSVALAVGLPHITPDLAPADPGTGAQVAAQATHGIGPSIGAALSAKVLLPFVVGVIAGVGGSEIHHRATDEKTAPAPEATVEERESNPVPDVENTKEEGDLENPTPRELPAVSLSFDDGKGAPLVAQKPEGYDKHRSRSLASERSLIEMARTALARGNGEDALSALQRHKAEHPRGKFEEEREALKILALVSTGQIATAHNQAENFRARHPKSMFLKAIDEALEKAHP